MAAQKSAEVITDDMAAMAAQKAIGDYMTAMAAEKINGEATADMGAMAAQKRHYHGGRQEGKRHYCYGGYGSREEKY